MSPQIVPLRQHDDGTASDRLGWMADAPCKRDPDLFFSEDAAEIEQAKKVCATACTKQSRAACLKYARDNRIPFGVFGGKDENERGITLDPVDPVTYVCENCDAETPYCKQGKWCAACYGRWNRAGRPDTGPPPVRPQAEILAAGRATTRAAAEDRKTRYVALRRSGKTRDEAARAVGLSRSWLYQYERLVNADLKRDEAEAHPWRVHDAVIDTEVAA